MEGVQTLKWHWWGQKRSEDCPYIKEEEEEPRPYFVLVKEDTAPQIVPLSRLGLKSDIFKEGLGCAHISSVYGTEYPNENHPNWLAQFLATFTGPGPRYLLRNINNRRNRRVKSSLHTGSTTVSGHLRSSLE